MISWPFLSWRIFQSLFAHVTYLTIFGMISCFHCIPTLSWETLSLRAQCDFTVKKYVVNPWHFYQLFYRFFMMIKILDKMETLVRLQKMTWLKKLWIFCPSQIIGEMMSKFQHFTAHLHLHSFGICCLLNFPIVKQPFYSSHHHAVGPLLGSR